MPRIHTRFSGLLASCLLFVCSAATPSLGQNTVIPHFIPGIEFKTSNGRVGKIFPGGEKLTILHLWATWCVPCVKELPDVDAVQAANGDYLVVLAISMDGENNMDKVRKFFADHNITHLLPLVDNGTATFKTVQAKGLPTTLFIDPKGKIVSRSDGPLDWKSAETKAFIQYYMNMQ